MARFFGGEVSFRLGERGRFLTDDVEERPFVTEADEELAKVDFIDGASAVDEDTPDFGAGGVWLSRRANFKTFLALEEVAGSLFPDGEEVLDDIEALLFFAETTPEFIPDAVALTFEDV